MVEVGSCNGLDWRERERETERQRDRVFSVAVADPHFRADERLSDAFGTPVRRC